eukprot:CAMPEP_0169185268 /NCGR_PEP_ID=MMETSP1016-20121227/1694_1 /TAXON_ID=342587 /ORGANISM="Karlodinium micrum, Strain CCMP2283" /LENGTH=315 /DNA_ID=CAMNT_0009260937 /DNA_START=29 /DNA_END=974 /DNA_ORIENTATION=-
MSQWRPPGDNPQVGSEHQQDLWSAAYVAATAAYATAADDRWSAALAASRRRSAAVEPSKISKLLPQVVEFSVIAMEDDPKMVASSETKAVHIPVDFASNFDFVVVSESSEALGSEGEIDIEDPTFGPGIVHNMDDPNNLHEAFLDFLHLEKQSPIRGHLLQLFRRPDLDEQLGRLYDEASDGAPKLSREAFTRISRGINGHLHQLLKGKERMPLAACTPEDQRWISTNFDQFFPPERPLDRRLFTGYFKLILMRRIVRTLVARIGLQKLRRGTSAPLVLVVGVDLGGGHPLFRINTVTPNAKKVTCGESLALIDE